MKYILLFSILAVALGGCVLVPGGYDDNRGGYDRDHGYNRGDGYNHRDANYYGYGNRDHGS